MEIEKKRLDVSRASSEKVSNTNIIFALIGWVATMLGVIFLCMGLYDEELANIIVGSSLLSVALTSLFVARLFLGLHPIVKASEVYNALKEEEYNIIKIKEEE